MTPADARVVRHHSHVLLACAYGGGADTIGEGQVYPFLRYRRSIRARLGLSFEHVNSNDLATIARACEAAAGRVSAFVIRPDWHHEAGELTRFFAGLRARHPDHWIVSIDPWDQCTGRFLGVLRYVDRLVKYQSLKNRDDYYRPMVGGTVLTDYMARRGVYDTATNVSIGSEVPDGAAARIVSGWYYWMRDSVRLELLKPRVWPFFPWKRDLDVVCHVSLGNRADPDSYYAFHRREAIAAIGQLGSEFAIRTSADYDAERKVSRRQYRADCRRARIMVSPFGWGEISSRDYEAALFGCLLVRPRADHMAVLPDILVAGETYVPIEWDCSDLAEKCRYYLAHWDEAERIIANARAVCLAYFARRQYLDVMRAMLGMEEPSPASSAAATAPANAGLSQPG